MALALKYYCSLDQLINIVIIYTFTINDQLFQKLFACAIYNIYPLGLDVLNIWNI